MRLSRRELIARAVISGGTLLGAGFVRASAGAPSRHPPSIATTASGRVRGTVRNDVHEFKGIPYGTASRFRPPSKPLGWNGIRNAIRFGPRCPQFHFVWNLDMQAYWPVEPPAEDESEDCLVLNVWTPALGESGRRPVMVWLHGGSFAAGSAAPYDLAPLAAFGDVVTVGINHRLNAFGFLYLGETHGEEYSDAGNVGMLDIVEALRWVKDNISSFGGDPANVTIFGESGGGKKVGTLMAMPLADGLYHRAIVQSGPMLKATEREDAKRITADIFKYLGLREGDVWALTRVPAPLLVKAVDVVAPLDTADGLHPVVDGRSLSHHPFHPTAPGNSARVPLMLGTTATEMTGILQLNTTAVAVNELFEIEEMRLADYVHEYGQMSRLDAERVIAVYRHDFPEASPSRLFFMITGDRTRGIRTMQQAERRAALGQAPAYLYVFAWETPILGGKLLSPHGVELPFVFHDVDNRMNANTGDGHDRYRLQDQVSGAWVAFARSGNPNHPGLPAWRPYEPTTRSTMFFDTVCRVIDDPNRPERLALISLPDG